MTEAHRVAEAYREIERKLRVPPGFALPDLTAVDGVMRVEPQSAFTMSNTYYDTPDLRLFRWGITLRLRLGSPDAGWHLKLPVDSAAAGARDEIRAAVAEELPAELANLVTAFVREAPLAPIATLTTQRTPLLLINAGGATRAEVVDDTVTVLDGQRVTMSFREIEVEALPSHDGSLDEDLLDRVAHHLIAAGAEPGTVSKVGAALGPRALVPPDIPELAWPDAHDPAGDVVRAYLALHTRRLVRADLRLRRDLPDAVHQMRVSARRLRSGLKVFRPLVDEDWAGRLRDELGWMASGLGEARDTEVLQERLDVHAETLGAEDAARARAVIDRVLEARMVAAAGAARAVVDSPRYRALLADLVDGVRRPPLTLQARLPADDVLPPLVAQAFRRLKRRIAALDLDTPSEQWHSARIIAKQARYAADAVAPVLGSDVGTLADQLADVTEILGHHQDSYVAQATLRDLSTQADPAAAFALGRLLGVEEAAEITDRVTLLDMWPRVRKAARQAQLTRVTPQTDPPHPPHSPHHGSR